MAKKKTEDELKSTISRQSGEITRLRRELAEKQEIMDEASIREAMHNEEAERNFKAGKGEIFLRDAMEKHGDVHNDLQRNRENLLYNMEREESLKLSILQKKRRMVFELGLNSGRMPRVQLAIDL